MTEIKCLEKQKRTNQKFVIYKSLLKNAIINLKMRVNMKSNNPKKSERNCNNLKDPQRKKSLFSTKERGIGSSVKNILLSSRKTQSYFRKISMYEKEKRSMCLWVMQ